MFEQRIRFPWFTLRATRPPGVARWRVFVAMLVHEAVELFAGTERAHRMASARAYGIGGGPQPPEPIGMRGVRARAPWRDRWLAGSGLVAVSQNGVQITASEFSGSWYRVEQMFNNQNVAQPYWFVTLTSWWSLTGDADSAAVIQLDCTALLSAISGLFAGNQTLIIGGHHGGSALVQLNSDSSAHPLTLARFSSSTLKVWAPDGTAYTVKMLTGDIFAVQAEFMLELD